MANEAGEAGKRGCDDDACLDTGGTVEVGVGVGVDCVEEVFVLMEVGAFALTDVLP